jgi:hypothetical protein
VKNIGGKGHEEYTTHMVSYSDLSLSIVKQRLSKLDGGAAEGNLQLFPNIREF